MTKPAWMTGLDMTVSTAIAKSMSMSQAELEARQAGEARQVAADHARRSASRAARKANAYSVDLIETIRTAFSEAA